MAKLSRFSRALRRSPKWKMLLPLVIATLVSLCIFFPDGIGGRRRSMMSSDGLEKRQWTETLFWEPRIFIYHNFLSKEECEHLIELARPYMKKSLVINKRTGRGQESRFRTSTGTFLKRGQDQVVWAIEKRIADFTFIPAEHGEGLQVLHYEVGQKYDPHIDYFVDEVNVRFGGQRIATILMYLSDVHEGGETEFPYAKINVTSLPRDNEQSDCGKQGLSIKPKMGDAVLFWSLKPDGSLDPLSFHGGCPVIRGNKWMSTKWLHVREVPP